MPVKCCAYKCSSVKCTDPSTHVTFHKFPFYDEKRLQAWVTALRWKDWKPCKTSLICSIHFEESYYKLHTKRRLLTDDAVPTIFPGFPSYLQKKTYRKSRYRDLTFSGGKLGKKISIQNAMAEYGFAVNTMRNKVPCRLTSAETSSQSVLNPGRLTTLEDDCASAAADALNATAVSNSKSSMKPQECLVTVVKPVREGIFKVQMPKMYNNSTTLITDPCDSVRKEYSIEEEYVKEEPLDFDHEEQSASSLNEEDLLPNRSFNKDTSCRSKYSIESPLNGDSKFEADEVAMVKFEKSVKIEIDESPYFYEDVELKTNISPASHSTKIFDTKIKKEVDFDANPVTEGKKSNQCHYCCKNYCWRGDLQKHILTHTGVKPHQCLYCKKRFSRKGYLIKHILTHTGEKPHECNHCGRKFSQKGGMQRHLLVHTGEKP